MYNNTVFFHKIRDVKDPNRANKHDAGIDFYVPKFDKEFRDRVEEINKDLSVVLVNFSSEWGKIIVKPGKRVLIPSGIKVWIVDKSTALIAFNKSGLSTQKGVTVTAQVVDADYTGEVHLGIINEGDEDFIIEPDQKLTQFLHMPYIQTNLSEVTEKQYNNMTQNTDRGQKGFGSSNNK